MEEKKKRRSSILKPQQFVVSKSDTADSTATFTIKRRVSFHNMRTVKEFSAECRDIIISPVKEPLKLHETTCSDGSTYSCTMRPLSNIDKSEANVSKAGETNDCSGSALHDDNHRQFSQQILSPDATFVVLHHVDVEQNENSDIVPMDMSDTENMSNTKTPKRAEISFRVTDMDISETEENTLNRTCSSESTMRILRNPTYVRRSSFMKQNESIMNDEPSLYPDDTRNLFVKSKYLFDQRTLISVDNEDSDENGANVTHAVIDPGSRKVSESHQFLGQDKSQATAESPDTTHQLVNYMRIDTAGKSLTEVVKEQSKSVLAAVPHNENATIVVQDFDRNINILDKEHHDPGKNFAAEYKKRSPEEQKSEEISSIGSVASDPALDERHLSNVLDKNTELNGSQIHHTCAVTKRPVQHSEKYGFSDSFAGISLDDIQFPQSFISPMLDEKKKSRVESPIDRDRQMPRRLYQSTADFSRDHGTKTITWNFSDVSVSPANAKDLDESKEAVFRNFVKCRRIIRRSIDKSYLRPSANIGLLDEPSSRYMSLNASDATFEQDTSIIKCEETCMDSMLSAASASFSLRTPEKCSEIMNETLTSHVKSLEIDSSMRMDMVYKIQPYDCSEVRSMKERIRVNIYKNLLNFNKMLEESNNYKLAEVMKVDPILAKSVKMLNSRQLSQEASEIFELSRLSTQAGWFDIRLKVAEKANEKIKELIKDTKLKVEELETLNASVKQPSELEKMESEMIRKWERLNSIDMTILPDKRVRRNKLQEVQKQLEKISLENIKLETEIVVCENELRQKKLEESIEELANFEKWRSENLSMKKDFVKSLEDELADIHRKYFG